MTMPGETTTAVVGFVRPGAGANTAGTTTGAGVTVGAGAGAGVGFVVAVGVGVGVGVGVEDPEEPDDAGGAGTPCVPRPRSHVTVPLYRAWPSLALPVPSP